MNEWKLLQAFYKNHFGISPDLLDKIAVEPLLEDCASGRSNQFIANKYDTDLEYVSEVLDEFLDFEGWENDLDVNPLMIYGSLDADFSYYKSVIKTVSCLVNQSDILLSYGICRKYTKIRKEIITNAN